MGLHFSLVVHHIMILAKFWLPIIASLGVIQELFGKCLIITLYLFSLLKKVGLRCSVFLLWGSGGYKSTGFLLSILVIVLPF
jgi:hypothetical protein